MFVHKSPESVSLKNLRIVLPDIHKYSPTMKPAVTLSDMQIKKSNKNKEFDDDKTLYKINENFFKDRSPATDDVSLYKFPSERRTSSSLKNKKFKNKIKVKFWGSKQAKSSPKNVKSIKPLEKKTFNNVSVASNSKPKSPSNRSPKSNVSSSGSLKPNSPSTGSPKKNNSSDGSPKKNGPSIGSPKKINPSNGSPTKNGPSLGSPKLISPRISSRLSKAEITSPKPNSPKTASQHRVRQKVSSLPPPLFTNQHIPMVTVPDDLTVHFNEEEANDLLITTDTLQNNSPRSKSRKGHSPQGSPKSKRRREEMNHNTDDLEYFAKYVVQKLRKMETNQRIYSENMINTVLMLGQLEQLNGSSKITL